MDSFPTISVASGALIRAEMLPRIETALMPTVQSAYRRPGMVTLATNRSTIGLHESSPLAPLASLLPLPPGTSVQLSCTTEANRYDKLKFAAEEMIREQISTRTERDMSVRPPALRFRAPDRY